MNSRDRKEYIQRSRVVCNSGVLVVHEPMGGAWYPQCSRVIDTQSTSPVYVGHATFEREKKDMSIVLPRRVNGHHTTNH